MSNQEMQFADPDWKPSQQLDPKSNQQEVYTPQPINSDLREQNKWGSAPSSLPQQEEYSGLRPYAGPVPGQMQGGNYRQRPYSRRGRGPLFWIILALIIFSLLGGGTRFSNGFSFGNGPDFGHGPFEQGPMPVPKAFDYTVNGQATLVINDQDATVTVIQGQTNTVDIQPVNGNSFPGNPNSLQQDVNASGNTITADIPTSQDLLVTVPAGSNVSLNTGSGTIDIKGVEAQMSLVTSDGTINANNDTLLGSSTFTTNTGDINFDGTISAGGNYQFITSSGTVRVVLPSSPAFHVDATTQSGTIHIPGLQTNGSGTQATGTIGAKSPVQGTQVTLKSDSGDINLNQK